MINKCFHSLSAVMNYVCDENVNHGEKRKVQHVLRRIEGDYVPIYVVRSEKSISIVSNYNFARTLSDTLNYVVYCVWYDHINNWHVTQQ